MVTRGAFLVCFCSAAGLMAAGQEPSSAPSSQIFGTGTTAVVVDVVVRDRKGNPVTDLRKQDFELFERGVRQEIADLTTVGVPRTRSSPVAGPEIAGGRTLLESSGAAANPWEPVRAPAFVALVFDRLSAEARAKRGGAATRPSYEPHAPGGTVRRVPHREQQRSRERPP